MVLINFCKITGLTETSPAALVLNPKFGNSKIGSCGNAIANTFVKVIDIESGKPLGPNLKGEVCVKGPQVGIKNFFLQIKKVLGKLIYNNYCDLLLCT